MQTQLVQLVGGNIQKAGHLVNESPCASGAGAVHPLVDTAVKKDDLRILAAQLDDSAGIRLQTAHHLPGGKHLLNKAHSGALRQSQTGGTGDGGGKGSLSHIGRGLVQKLQRLLPHLRKMPLIFFKKNSTPVHHNDLGGGGPDIDAQCQIAVVPHIFSPYW